MRPRSSGGSLAIAHTRLATIGRLKDVWQDEHAQWRKRDLSAKRYIHVWAQWHYLEARLEDEKQCILVLIGDGARESIHNWRNLLLQLKRRGLEVSPELAIADGGLGFWKAAGEVWPKRAINAAGCTRPPMCWPSCRRPNNN